MPTCHHTTEPYTGRSAEVEVKLSIEPKGTPKDLHSPNVLAFTAVAYAIAEVTCRKCGKQISRASIEVKPENIETQAFYPPNMRTTP